MQVALGALAIAGSALGILAARSVYLRSTKSVERLEPEILRRAWRVDEVIAAFFGGPGRAIADGTADFDRQVVDGAVNGVGVAVREGGTRLRETQTGYVRHYALGMAGGAACLLAFFFVRVGL